MLNFGKMLGDAIPQPFLLEFEERVRAAGRRAKEVTGALAVGKRSGARVRGQIRTALIEQGIVDASHASGFPAEEAGMLEGVELYLYQAYARINRAIVVRATLGAAPGLPTLNKTRKRLVEKINGVYSRDLFRPELVVDAGGAIAVFLIVTPNPAATDGIGAISVAVVDDRYDHYLFNEPLEEFMARYTTAPTSVEEPQLLTRRGVGRYVPPEEDAGPEVVPGEKPVTK
jgi:hypothetical protein